MPRQSRRSRYQRSNSVSVGQLLVIAAAIILLCVIGGYFVYSNFLADKEEYDSNTACRLVNNEINPNGHTVILIDETDVLTPIQQDYIKAHLNRFVQDELQIGELLSIYLLDDQLISGRRPVFNMCKMRDGSDADKFTENQRLMAMRFQKTFQGPFKQRLDSAISGKTSLDYSPIFEALQLIAVNSFDKYKVNGDKRLLIFSDMLHRTPKPNEYSMFTQKHSFEQLKKTNYYQKVKTYMPGTIVSLYILSSYPQYQKMDLAEFWKDYFRDSGAYVEQIIPVGY